jgi:hypothetical protein
MPSKTFFRELMDGAVGDTDPFGQLALAQSLLVPDFLKA